MDQVRGVEMDAEGSQLHSQAISLVAKFMQGGEMNYIDEAIVLDREALELHPPGHPNRPDSLTCLAIHLGNRYSRFEAIRDLEEAIVLDKEALDLWPQGHPHRSVSLINLAARLSIRYTRLGAVQDLNEAIVLDREALALHPQAHPCRWMSLNGLADHLSTRYNQLGEMQDLNEAIVLDREATALRSQGHPDYPISLNNLVVHLSARYNQLGALQDLDEAITLGRETLALRPQGHRDRSISLTNLASNLWGQYKQLGALQDLNEAIVLSREALDLRPQGHPTRWMTLNNLAVHLSTRHRQLGAVQDLNETIVLGREALALLPQVHPGRSTSLNNLAIELSTRYRQLRAVQDLNEAIALDREALILRPQGHPDRSIALNNLATDLSIRYNRLEEMQDLNESIVLCREALALRPQGHPNRAATLTNLAGDLSTRYQHLRAIQDLSEAIALDREALALRPQGHPDRLMSLNNLAAHLSCQYNQLGAMQDLNEAIILGREALDLHPQGHPDRSMALNNLAGYLCDQFEQSKELKDKEEVFSHYAQLVHVTQIVSSSDLSAARQWIRTAEDFQHPTLLLAYRTSLRLLTQHLVMLPSLPQHLDILRNLTSSLAVDSFSACLRNCSPTDAVELLEQGRAVFWNQLTRLRSPLEDVVASGPAGKILAEDLTRLSSLIRNAIDSPGPDQHERVYSLNVEMERVVTGIRNLPGLSRFLLPSLFSDLRGVAIGGPVIIVNTSGHSCDALVILLDQDPVHVPLEITRTSTQELSKELHTLTVRAKRANVTKVLASFLRKLWDEIVSPIVDVLKTTVTSGSRIWWCPTAELSLLPLHAAGPYRKGQRNLPEIYISSYTPTLTTLIRARRRAPSSLSTEGRRFVAIGQTNAVGESELPSVGAELDSINKHLDGLTTFTRIDGEASCISRVIDELGKSEWVHFACHGLPNTTKPFESAFALHDGHFTIQRIIGCDLKNPEFAYLSACHTTVGYEDSPDEVIHLASAMQFAGFRSVIGTMWAVDDGETSKITSTFYKHLVDESGCLDYTRAAFALNKTMRSVNVPLDQRILYIHFGA